MKPRPFSPYRGLFSVGVMLLLSGAMARTAGAAPQAYVANYSSDTVSVIDTATDSVGATVTVGLNPLGVAVSPDGSRVYVTNYGSGTVSVIDTATDSVGATVTVGLNPAGVAASPDGSRVYAANYGSGTVSVIDTANDTVGATVTVGLNPAGVAASPDGSRVYVANYGSGTVSVIDTANDAVGATVTVGVNPIGVAVSPDGSRVYVANGSNGTVSVIDTATDTVGATVTVGSAPYGVAVSPDGSRVYVANGSSGTVSVIDTATDSVGATVTVGAAGPSGVAVSPDGSRVYVTNEGNVSVIDTATDTVGATVTVGSGPYGVAVSPDGSRVYVTNETSGTVSVIDTANDAVGATVTVGSYPTSLGAFVGPGALIAGNSSASGSVGSQITASVPALVNGTPCATSDALVQSPVRGSVVFTASTGAYTYTPSSATYSGPDAFTWQGQAPASCTAADSPTDPVSNAAAVFLTIDPVLSGLSDVTLDENAGTEEAFELGGTAPFTLALASSNTGVLPVSDVTVSSGCGATEAGLGCMLKLASGSQVGSSNVTVTASDAFGDPVTETVVVTVAAPAPPPAPPASGGGGGFSPLALGILFGFWGLLGWTRRKRAAEARG
jgi:YVTN family beta-propeller protein